MAINDKTKNKSKVVAFKANVYDKEKYIEDTNENMSNFIALLTKRFGKVMMRLDRRSRNNVMTNAKDKVLDKSMGFNSQRRNKEGDNQEKKKGKGIKYNECE